MEIWKDIEGYEGIYKISSLGRVKSFKRYPKGKILKCTINSRGYRQARLYDGESSEYIHVHRLVAKHFIPITEENLVVDHIDNDKLNNRVDNLRWITQSENISKDRKNKTSNYIGIYKQGKSWIATYTIDKKQKYLGSFKTEEDANLFRINYISETLNNKTIEL